MRFVVTVSVRLSLQVDADSVRQAHFRAEEASNLMFDAVNRVWLGGKRPKYPDWFEGYRSQSVFQKAKSERGTLDLYSGDWKQPDGEVLVRHSSTYDVTGGE